MCGVSPPPSSSSSSSLLLMLVAGSTDGHILRAQLGGERPPCEWLVVINFCTSILLSLRTRARGCCNHGGSKVVVRCLQSTHLCSTSMQCKCMATIRGPTESVGSYSK
uniref:Putative secreted protein n=1 Tax=Anopheles marajoara TaxID=58244 RepID=A0A2M4C8C2_9DIPT